MIMLIIISGTRIWLQDQICCHVPIVISLQGIEESQPTFRIPGVETHLLILILLPNHSLEATFYWRVYLLIWEVFIVIHPIGAIKTFTLIDRSVEITIKLKKLSYEGILFEYNYLKGFGYIISDWTYSTIEYIAVLLTHSFE